MAEDISAGSVSVEVVPDARNFWKTFRAKTAPSADKAGRDVGKQIADIAARYIGDGIRDGVDRGARGSRVQGAKAGNDFGSSWSRAAAAHLSKNLQVNVETAQARAEIQAVTAAAQNLARSRPNIEVNADTAGAIGQLAATKVAAEALDRTSVNIDTAPAVRSGENLFRTFSRIGNTTFGISRLGPAVALSLVPSLLAIASAAGAALVAVTALAAGLGAGLLGAATAVGFAFSGVGEALSALQKRQDSAGRSAAQSAQQQVNSAYQIQNAQRGVADAQRQVREAMRGVADAERSLADAQREAKRAQEDLSAARRQARRDLEDLTLAVEGNRLSMRRADLAVERAGENLDSLGPSQIEIAKATSALATAQERYDKVAGNPRSTDAQKLAAKTALDASKAKLAEMQASISGTELERKEAKLAYDEAKLRQKETAVALKRSVADKAKADKQGIEGSDRVRAASDRVAQANRGVADAQRGVAAANRRVADAQRGVVTAQQQLAHTMEQASTRGAAAAGRVADEFDKLPRSGQRFVRFLRGQIIPQLDRLKRIAGRNLFPGLTAGLRAMEPLWRPIGKAVSQFSRALGGLAKSAGKALGGKLWKDFVRLLGDIGSQAITEAGKSFGYLAKAFATLFVAFAPLIREMLPGMTKLAKSFADWAAEWVKSGGFKEFIAYIKANGPKLLDLLGNIIKFAIELLIAFAPLAGPILDTLNRLFAALTKLAPAIAFVSSAVTEMGRQFLGAISWALDFVANFRQRMSSLWSWTKKTWRSGKASVSKTWGAMWQGAKDTTTNAKRVIGQKISDFVKNAKSSFDWAKQKISDAWRTLWDNARRKATDTWNTIRNGVSNFLTKVRDRFSTGVAAIGKAWDDLKKKAKAPVRFVVDTVINEGIVAPLKTVAGWFSKSLAEKIKKVPVPFRNGGYVRGPGTGTSDSINARLSNGEYVMPAAETRKNLPALEAMRSGASILPGFARGGLVEFGKLLRRRGFRVGEHPAFGGVAPVHTNGSWHYKGGAIDVNWGPGGQSAAEMKKFDALIKSGIARSYGLRSIWRYPGHYDHAHFDIGSGPDLGMGQGKGGGKGILGLLGSLNPLGGLIDKIKKQFDGAPLYGQIVKSSLTGVVSRLTDWLGTKINPFGGGGRAVEANGPIREIVQQTAAQFGWGTGRQWAALSNLIQRESSWNPSAQNPTSSAYGLFQFLNGTWGTVGGRKTSNPAKQALYGMRYIRQRYNSPVGAMNFWNRNHWYDEGGYLPPGLNLVMNGTGKPEPVFTHDQFEDMKAGGLGGSGAPLIGEYHVHPQDAPAEVSALNITLRHLRRGGVYATG